MKKTKPIQIDYKLVLCASSYPRMGLLKHMTDWAIFWHKQKVDVMVVSGPGEQEPGLHVQLASRKVPVTVIEQLDNAWPWRWLKTLSQIKKLLQTIDQKIVVQVMGLGHALDFYLAAKLARKKINLICTLEACAHGSFYERVAYKSTAFLSNRITTCLVAISGLDQQKLLRSGVNPQKIAYIPNFINLDVFKKNSRQVFLNKDLANKIKKASPVLVYLAQLEPRKNHLLLLRIVQRLKANYPDLLLVLAGAGFAQRQIESFIEKNGLAKNVILGGRLPHHQVPALLSSSQLSIVTSYAETFGWLIVEPVLAGVPVISTPVGIAPEMAAAGGLLTVDHMDEAAFYQQALYFLRQPKAGKKAVKQGQGYIKKNFAIEVVSRKYQELYEQAIAKH
jgi:glycosyltransferase involved in cell wall biosynthesis